MAGAHHDAALGQQRCRAEAVLVGAKQRGDDDVAAGLDAAVDANADPPAQLVMRSVCCVSARPISQGMPAFLMEDRGLAPVPPSIPAICTTSARPFTTPAAIVPTPASATSLTEMAARGLTCLRS